MKLTSRCSRAIHNAIHNGGNVDRNVDRRARSRRRWSLWSTIIDSDGDGEDFTVDVDELGGSPSQESIVNEVMN